MIGVKAFFGREGRGAPIHKQKSPILPREKKTELGKSRNNQSKERRAVSVRLRSGSGGFPKNKKKRGGKGSTAKQERAKPK